MSEKEKEQTIRVVDKRRFASNGSEKAGSEDRYEKQLQDESQPRTQMKDTEQPKQAQPRTEKEETSPVNFSAFLMGLATQVLALLGEIPNPETNLVTVNFEAARQTIDILCMLQEKTKGNLTADEEQMMDEVVHSLKIAFVAKVEEKNKGKK